MKEIASLNSTVRCLLALVLGLAGFVAPAEERPAVRFEGLGNHSRRVSTRSPEAQQRFDQGLAFLYAFNHDEAIRSFHHSAELDLNCAMPHQGIAGQWPAYQLPAG